MGIQRPKRPAPPCVPRPHVMTSVAPAPLAPDVYLSGRKPRCLVTVYANSRVTRCLVGLCRARGILTAPGSKLPPVAQDGPGTVTYDCVGPADALADLLARPFVLHWQYAMSGGRGPRNLADGGTVAQSAGAGADKPRARWVARKVRGSLVYSEAYGSERELVGPPSAPAKPVKDKGGAAARLDRTSDADCARAAFAAGLSAGGVDPPARTQAIALAMQAAFVRE